MRKKSKFIILVAVALVCLIATTVSANTHTINLYTNQTSVSTSVHRADQVKCQNVYNYSYSDREVYCKLYDSNVWGQVTALSHLVEQGETYNSGWIDSVGPGPDDWQMNLNPYGWLTAGCRAYGTLVYE